MKFQQLCTRCQTANRLVSTREKEDFEGNTCVLGNFCHQFDLVNSTQHSAAMVTQKTKSASQETQEFQPGLSLKFSECYFQV